LYRPTIRYNQTYRTFIDSIFYYSNLDRNQILRLALHIAAHSDAFQKVIESHRRTKDVPPPFPIWSVENHSIWLDNKGLEQEGEGEAHETISGKESGAKQQPTRVNELDPVTNGNEPTESNHKQEQQHRRIEPTQGRIREVHAFPIYRDGRIQCRGTDGIRIKIN